MTTFTAPLAEAGASVETVVIRPVTDYNFPWTGKRFFSVMPSCVLGIPEQLEPLELKEEGYDLIILGYQPWFLSPSIPSNSLLQNEAFKALLKDTPVITISAARNMWLNAFTRVRNMLKDASAVLVGNVALVDKHPNPVSFVTIFYWMLSGKKERYLNIFPKPGVSEEDIANTSEPVTTMRLAIFYIDFFYNARKHSFCNQFFGAVEHLHITFKFSETKILFF